MQIKLAGVMVDDQEKALPPGRTYQKALFDDMGLFAAVLFARAVSSDVGRVSIHDSPSVPRYLTTPLSTSNS
jgi:hypothetical protein